MHSIGLQVLLQLREELNYLLYYNTIQGQCLNVNRVLGFSVRIIVIGKKIYLRIIATEFPYHQENACILIPRVTKRISNTCMHCLITYVDNSNLA